MRVLVGVLIGLARARIGVCLRLAARVLPRDDVLEWPGLLTPPITRDWRRVSHPHRSPELCGRNAAIGCDMNCVMAFANALRHFARPRQRCARIGCREIAARR